MPSLLTRSALCWLRLLCRAVRSCVPLLVVAGPAVTAAEPLQQLPASVAGALEGRGVAAGSIGLYVREVTAETPLIVVNADKAFNPASTMKLVVTYAGLNLLGPTDCLRRTRSCAGCTLAESLGTLPQEHQPTRVANVTLPTASAHPARVTGSGMLVMEKQGRHGYFRLAAVTVARMVESFLQPGISTPITCFIRSEERVFLRLPSSPHGAA